MLKRTKQMRVVVEVIDSEFADRALKRNHPDNRAISRAHVERIKQNLHDGTFATTHQGVAFDWDGWLRDGQHRLTAIKETGSSVSMVVTYDADPSIFQHVDTESRVRTFADSLRIGGLNVEKRHVSAARMIMSVEDGGGSYGQHTLSSVSEFIARRTGTLNRSLDLTNFKTLSHASIVAVVELMLHHQPKHEDDVAAWCEVMRTGISVDPWHASAIAFRDFWMTGAKINSTKTRFVYSRKCYASMRAFVERRIIKTLQEASFPAAWIRKGGNE